MGWLSWGASQIVFTSVSIGALKRHGVLVLKPEGIKNETLRGTLVQAVNLGESLAELVERLSKQAYDAVQSSTSKK